MNMLSATLKSSIARQLSAGTCQTATRTLTTTATGAALNRSYLYGGSIVQFQKYTRFKYAASSNLLWPNVGEVTADEVWRYNLWLGRQRRACRQTCSERPVSQLLIRELIRVCVQRFTNYEVDEVWTSQSRTYRGAAKFGEYQPLPWWYSTSSGFKCTSVRAGLIQRYRWRYLLSGPSFYLKSIRQRSLTTFQGRYSPRTKQTPERLKKAMAMVLCGSLPV